MTTHIERELSRVLNERAELIDAAPPYRLAPLPKPVRSVARPQRHAGSRRMWTVWGSVAAVAATIAAVAVGVRVASEHDSRPDKHAVASRCVATASSPFAVALRSGALPAGAVVLSGAADGTLLLAMQRNGVTQAVELVSAAGDVLTVWTASPSERLRAVANPSGAITDSWAVFVLTPVDRTGASHTVVADRTNGHLTELAPDSGYAVSLDPLVAPIAMGDAVTVLETSRTDPSAQQLALYWADITLHTSEIRTPTSGVTSLLPVGGNEVRVRSRTHGLVSVDFDPPQYRPSTLEPATRHGYAFSSDATTLTWLSPVGDQYYLWQWAPGYPSPLRRSLAVTSRPVTAAGRFVVTGPPTSHAAQQLLDSSTSKVIELPPGMSLLRVDGPTAILTQRTTAGDRYYRIPVAALTTC